MFMFYDFHCTDCGVTHESFCLTTEVEHDCQACGGTARRILSAVRIDRTRMAGTGSASPESIAHFDRIHQQRKIIEERNLANHGDVGKMPGSD